MNLPTTATGHWDTPEGLAMAQTYVVKPRRHLGLPEMSDFDLANKQFMANRESLELIMYQTAVKERIRWLSARLAMAEALLREAGGLIDEALEQHIYDTRNGDVIPDDCSFTACSSEIGAFLAEAPPPAERQQLVIVVKDGMVEGLYGHALAHETIEVFIADRDDVDDSPNSFLVLERAPKRPHTIPPAPWRIRCNVGDETIHPLLKPVDAPEDAAESDG